jgi:hypothetical protein
MTVCFSLSLTIQAQASGKGPCDADRFDTKPRMGSGLVHQKNERLIRCAVRRWPVAGGASHAIAVFDCESSLWSWAHNGSQLGVGQVSSWVSRARVYLRRAWFNDAQWRRVLTSPQGAYLARANILLSVIHAHRYGWGWWSCA